MLPATALQGLHEFWISIQDFALATQVNRSLYTTLELPLLLPSPWSHIAMQSGVVPEDDDVENELLPETPHRAAKLVHARAHRLCWLPVVRLSLVQPGGPAVAASTPTPRSRLENTRRTRFTSPSSMSPGLRSYTCPSEMSARQPA
jgi:hypothetical protein